MTLSLSPPRSETELLERAQRIAGCTLALVADELGWPVPADLRRQKGWVGQLLEAALGASASTRPEPDFVEIGVELKSIPVDRTGDPRESTFICTAALNEIGSREWPASQVKKKLTRVLWMPVEADPGTPLFERRIGSPLLWSPSEEEESVLREDWEELVQLIAAGYVDSITGDRGRWLQIRPKAADARSRTWGADDEGDPILTLPRGFYLRRLFTRMLLRRHFRRPG